LPEGVNKRLTAYALAAGAAGVGLLALAEPAQADIIVSNTPISIGQNSTKFLTINGNDVLKFSNNGGCSPPFGLSSCRQRVYARAAGSGAGALQGSDSRGLVKGAKIGPGGLFQSAVLLASCRNAGSSFKFCFRTEFGWNKSGYLGFKFLSNGRTQFGWAHVALPRTGPPTSFFAPSISKWAYDTVPGQTIEAGQTSAIPEPSTLSLLALGAAGLAVLRKRKLAAVSPSQSGRD
jgi:hypothetical protein